VIEGNLFLAILAAFSGPTDPVPRVSLGAVATNSAYWERPVEACGRVIVFRGGDAEARLESGAGYDQVRIYVARSGAQLPPPGTWACVTGEFRRRDGLTTAEATAGGIGWGRLSHPIMNTTYVFYPTAVEICRQPDCSD